MVNLRGYANYTYAYYMHKMGRTLYSNKMRTLKECTHTNHPSKCLQTCVYHQYLPIGPPVAKLAHIQGRAFFACIHKYTQINTVHILCVRLFCICQIVHFSRIWRSSSTPCARVIQTSSMNLV